MTPTCEVYIFPLAGTDNCTIHWMQPTRLCRCPSGMISNEVNFVFKNKIKSDLFTAQL
ncbi:unnamed protein product [Tenebrio molitor]|nr:unnamed protein product [Tenebrio molitor]